ncbi:hypothetical protein CPTAKMECS_200 [Salmonella phage vB_SenS-AKM_ECS]|uniref:Uncharacterized protein n=1 Tax=Salmonella phage vB_SenS-AKM_HA2021_32 TaxID=3158841 RepID=A0AAU7L2N6_9CAUD|nr:hypothetical protein CPTAKMECS_200 [Salmonella phage vB_SenS-AKM_ECS]
MIFQKSIFCCYFSLTNKFRRALIG